MHRIDKIAVMHLKGASSLHVDEANVRSVQLNHRIFFMYFVLAMQYTYVL